MSLDTPSQSPTDETVIKAFEACLVGALASETPHEDYEPTTTASYQQLQSMLEAGGSIDDTLGMFGEKREDGLLGSLRSELAVAYESYTTDKFQRLLKMSHSLIVLGGEFGWYPDLEGVKGDDDSLLIDQNFVHGLAARAEGQNRQIDRKTARASSVSSPRLPRI